jgi:hypothetical protein
VNVLARAETIALLRARIPALSEELAAELGDLPLAAAQAVGYLEQTALPPADYLRRFRTPPRRPAGPRQRDRLLRAARHRLGTVPGAIPVSTSSSAEPPALRLDRRAAGTAPSAPRQHCCATPGLSRPTA